MDITKERTVTRSKNGSGPSRASDLPFHARGPGERRNVAMGRSGMVAAQHPLATAAGLWALERGGNAMDAALAAAGVCGVVLPASCGLGGDCFLLYYDAKTQNVTGVNGSGAVPQDRHARVVQGARPHQQDADARPALGRHSRRGGRLFHGLRAMGQHPDERPPPPRRAVRPQRRRPHAAHRGDDRQYRRGAEGAAGRRGEDAPEGR